MKITFISPSLNQGGGTKVILIHAKELVELGHDVTIVSQGKYGQSFVDRLRSLKRGEGWQRFPKIRTPNGVTHIEIDSIRPVVAGDVPDSDVVIATWWETAEWVAKLPVSKGRKFYFVQGHEVYEPLPPESRETYKLPLQKVVVSKWLQRIMLEAYGDDTAILVPNSVDRSQFYAVERTKPRRPTVGLLYSTSKQKGVDVSISVIEKVLKQIDDLQILSFGSVPISRQLQLPPSSEFKFSPSVDQIRALYQQCSLWLTSSTSEGFNMTALEAMACRTPLVATDVGWPSDGVVEGVNGYLRQVGDVDGLGEAVTRILLSSEDEWRSMSEAAGQATTTASWKESAKLFAAALATGRSL